MTDTAKPKKIKKKYYKSALVGAAVGLSLISLTLAGFVGLVLLVASSFGITSSGAALAAGVITGSLAVTGGAAYSARRIFKKISKPKFSFLSAGASAVVTVAMAAGLTTMSFDKGGEPSPPMDPLNKKFQDACREKGPGGVIYDQNKNVVYVCPPVPLKPAPNLKKMI